MLGRREEATGTTVLQTTAYIDYRDRKLVNYRDDSHAVSKLVNESGRWTGTATALLEHLTTYILTP
jgi:hypothetical protein